ncbi:MAG: nitroreductase family deazaflavin-dependent oxidoreductase [Chloroflexi bacterium]|nr:nitroreductase family deazaflavin-dependent oxidoreductase [Chloroflexota bacterium]
MTPSDQRLITETRELDLITTGRKSGTPRVVELWYAYEKGYVYFLTSSTHWRRNLEAHPEAALQVKGRTFLGRYKPVTDAPASKEQVMALFRRKYGDQVVHQWYEGREHVVVRLRVAT